MRRALTLTALLPLLAACADFTGAGLPTGAPETAPAPEERQVPRSAESLESEQFFTRVESSLIARGLLRIDGGGPDTPFTGDMLARNFMALAFSQEFSEVGGRIVRQSADGALHRWVASVRLMPVAGPSVAPDRVNDDLQQIDRLAARLTRAARHPVGVVDSGGNFPVLLLNQNELATAGPLLRRFLPGLSDAEVRFVETLPRETYCVVLAADRGDTGAYTTAIAIIRAELPGRLRTSCLHEEIAQGLGIANDSPMARPSIFNDDDEFGRLTSHDELLLRMLYDPRLRPGMTAEEAAPIVRIMARDLVEGSA
ncbi:MAG: DUF2927 domain-containing protein [Pseudomonadota bacterium]